jgi:hypothetical protein
MNHKKNLTALAVIAISISVIGFIIDSDERTNSALYSLFELLVMSAVIFGLLNILYLGTVVVADMLKDAKRLNNGSL